MVSPISKKGVIMLSGDKLKFLRIFHNITQMKMAEYIGKSDRWVRKIESGDEIPTEEVYLDWVNACYGRIKKREKVESPKVDSEKKEVKPKKKTTTKKK